MDAEYDAIVVGGDGSGLAAAVDESLQVLDGQDRSIPGLYAAGQVGLGNQVLWDRGRRVDCAGPIDSAGFIPFTRLVS